MPIQNTLFTVITILTANHEINEEGKDHIMQ